MLQDDFKITKKIATGGFGTVYRAELDDGKTPGGRPVIIKKVSHTVHMAGVVSTYFGLTFRLSPHTLPLQWLAATIPPPARDMLTMSS